VAQILAVVGLRREARLIGGPEVRCIAGGGDQRRLEAELDAASPGAAGIISIGLAGALAEGLSPGDWVVGTAVVLPAGRIAADAGWSERLALQLAPAMIGDVAGSEGPVADVAAKRELHARTGALAVDMESHIAASAASRHGLPFAVARVISDGAGRALPPAALAGMKPDGSMDAGAVLRALARRPGELPALIRTALEAETAFRALARGRQLLGGALVGPGPDLGELLVHMA
jgi:adenosylhomocysteine nucleosidase